MGDKQLLLALGNEYRSDDGLGQVIMHKMQQEYPDRFKYLYHNSDPAALIELWVGQEVIIIDAIEHPERSPGEVVRIHPLLEKLQLPHKQTSSHALNIQEAIALGEVLHKMPKSLLVVGAVASSFAYGMELSLAVRNSIPKIIATLLAETDKPEHDHA